jgi:polar amino acid transport system substrate-binding protein
MTSFMLGRRAAIATLSSAAFCVAAQADTLDTIMRTKRLRVGIDLGAPFYGFTDEKLQPTGSDVDGARLLAADMGMELEIIQTTNPTRIPNLQTNKADIIFSSLSITPERAKIVDFTIPYGAIQSVVAAPQGIVIRGFDDLAGKTVAITRGGTQDKDLTDNAPKANLIRFDDDATSITAAATGQTDIIALTPPMIRKIAELNPARRFEIKFVINTYYLAIAIRKNEPRQLEWLNTWVKTNLKNGKLNAIQKKYSGVDIPQEVLDKAI